MTPAHLRKYRNDPAGRTMALCDWIVAHLAGTGWTVADAHALLASPTSEVHWRQLTLAAPDFTHDDRATVLRTLERWATKWPGPIDGRDIRTVEPRRAGSHTADPFGGLEQ